MFSAGQINTDSVSADYSSLVHGVQREARV